MGHNQSDNATKSGRDPRKQLKWWNTCRQVRAEEGGLRAWRYTLTHTHTAATINTKRNFAPAPRCSAVIATSLSLDAFYLKEMKTMRQRHCKYFFKKSTPPNPVLRLFICIITTAVNGNPGPPLSPGKICSSGVHKDLTTTKIQSTGFPSCLHFLLGT